MKPTVFIDGQHGTTGIELQQRLAQHGGFTCLEIDHSDRHDADKRRDAMATSDVVVLCLPDDAAIEAVATIQDLPGTGPSILDASTAHRVDPRWVYGMAECHATQRTRIQSATQVSNPGCYPTGFIAAIQPLVDAGLLPSNLPVSVHAVSGYSGGGKNMIADYEAASRATQASDAVGGTWAARTYGLTLQHKHLPEMQKYAGLTQPPLFVPMVGDYYKGMLVQIPLFLQQLTADAQTLHDCWQSRYENEPAIRVMDLNPMDALEGNFLLPDQSNDSYGVDLMMFANDSQALLVARLDNLGKGAAGAAVQNLNLMLGQPEFTGLF